MTLNHVYSCKLFGRCSCWAGSLVHHASELPGKLFSGQRASVFSELAMERIKGLEFVISMSGIIGHRPGVPGAEETATSLVSAMRVALVFSAKLC